MTRKKSAQINADGSVIKFQSGVSSSACPNYKLIPRAALIAYARRLDRGIRIKKEQAWNNLSKNQGCLDDVDFIIDRLQHGIDHCYLAIGRLAGIIPPASEEEEDDGGDAGAIMFAGGLLATAKEKWRGNEHS